METPIERDNEDTIEGGYQYMGDFFFFMALFQPPMYDYKEDVIKFVNMRRNIELVAEKITPEKFAIGWYAWFWEAVLHLRKTHAPLSPDIIIQRMTQHLTLNKWQVSAIHGFFEDYADFSMLERGLYHADEIASRKGWKLNR